MILIAILRLIQLSDDDVDSVNNRDSSNAPAKQEEEEKKAEDVSENYVIC